MKRIQFVTRHKGGGGAAPTESIPAWARPYMENVATTAEQQYEAGSLGRVAGESGLQNKAFTTGAAGIESGMTGGIGAIEGSRARLEDIARTGTGFTGGEALKAGATQEAGQAIAGLGNQYGAAGTLGSARNAIANKAVEAGLAAKFADIDRTIAKDDLAAKMQAEQGITSGASAGLGLATSGTSALANLGGQERTIEQQELDKDFQALNRYASTVYGLPARQQATSSSGGK